MHRCWWGLGKIWMNRFDRLKNNNALCSIGYCGQYSSQEPLLRLNRPWARDPKLGQQYRNGALNLTLIFDRLCTWVLIHHSLELSSQWLIWNIPGNDLCKKHGWNYCPHLVPKSGLAHKLRVSGYNKVSEIDPYNAFHQSSILSDTSQKKICSTFQLWSHSTLSDWNFPI